MAIWVFRMRMGFTAVNSVKNGYIRTEADELQYNLHIMLRYDLERALIAGDLMVNDLEAAWNDRFLADFGYAVPKASLGMLQDIIGQMFDWVFPNLCHRQYLCGLLARGDVERCAKCHL